MSKSKNGISYEYMAFKLLTEFPDITPKDFEVLLELMSDWELLSKEGNKVHSVIFKAVWED